MVGEKRRRGLKPRLIFNGLRGPKGPLFHGSTDKSEFSANCEARRCWRDYRCAEAPLFHWALDAGHWALDAGHWLLATNYSSLTAAFTRPPPHDRPAGVCC